MSEHGCNIIVNGQTVPLTGEDNLLEVIRKANIQLPTLCYFPGLSAFGGCRQCIVEDATGEILTSCTTVPRDGMSVRTHTPKVQRLRRIALELLLSQHERSCTTCGKTGDCTLQTLAKSCDLDHVRFAPMPQAHRVPPVNGGALTYDPNKCIVCTGCVRTCEEVQGLSAIDLIGNGLTLKVRPPFDRELDAVACVQCGQCAVVCPTGALMIRRETQAAWNAIYDPDKVVVVQIAPAVRVAIGEAFGLEPGTVSMGKLVTALRMLGVDLVFDTVFAADLTVMEEAAELIAKLGAEERLPHFTSCCPAWVKFAEHEYPDLLPNLSSCRSPQQMFGSLMKRHYAQQLGREPEDIFMLSIMPCTAKKFEAGRQEFATDGVRDVDLVLTTQEIVAMIQESGIQFRDLPEGELDIPFGSTTGAGMIFGFTGGVSEAVLRTAHWMVTGDVAADDAFTPESSSEGLSTATVQVGDKNLRMAITHTLGQARRVIESIRSGQVQYDIIEVMACPGGCVGGAGQPYGGNKETRASRSVGLRNLDRTMGVRKAQNNPVVQALYKTWLGKPNSEVSHTFLHTTYVDRSKLGD